MKTFSELNTQASDIAQGYTDSTVTDTTIKNTLSFFAEVKYLCESIEGMIYQSGNENYSLRCMRDLCIAGLNYAGNTKLLKCRFYSVWQQINAIVY